GSEPDSVDVGDLGEDGVEVVNGFEGLDLDHDGGLLVEVLVDGFGSVEAGVCEAGDEAEGGSGAGAALLAAEFGG
ncbi:MAG: hypothetical protein Q9187_000635, partial [Circinaria calcarea]